MINNFFPEKICTFISTEKILKFWQPYNSKFLIHIINISSLKKKKSKEINLFFFQQLLKFYKINTYYRKAIIYTKKVSSVQKEK